MKTTLPAVTMVSLVTVVFLTGCQSTPTAAPASPPTAAAAAKPAMAPAVVPQPQALKPFDWRDAVLYFVIVDRFADGDAANNEKADTTGKGTFYGGDLRGLTKNLDEIATLGVNAIWITPIVENTPGFVTGAGFPDWAYHGYWADDFTKLDRRFGTEDDMKAFVNACHARGIRVLLDVVYNHAGYNSKMTRDPRMKAWFRSNEVGDCGKDDLTSCVAGLPDFKTEMPEVADYLLTQQIGWAKKLGIDGFRLDTVKHVDHPFWQEHRKRTREALGKGFFLLGEVWGGEVKGLDAWFVNDEMDAGFEFMFQGSTIAYISGRGRTQGYDRYLKSRERVRAGYHLSHFLSSHDVDGALFQLEGDKKLFRMAAILQLTTGGIPVIYYGEEVGRLGGKWPENRSAMPWGKKDVLPGKGQERDEALRADYTRWVGIRNAHPALRRGVHEAVVMEQDLYAFARKDAESGDTVVVAVNRGAQAATLTMPVPAEWSGKTVLDRLTDKAVEVKDGKIQIPVDGQGARILAPLPQVPAKAGM
jgi:alpha-amylase